MSIHVSLKGANTMKRHRSVLSRIERVKILEERGSLNLEESSVFGLPKVKHLKLRIKKEKAAAAPSAGTAEGTAATPGAAAPSAAAPSKPAGKASGPTPKTEAGAPSKKKE